MPKLSDRNPHELGAYSIKLINPTITEELKTRATSGGSLETLFPFARLTSAIELPSDVGLKTNNRITKSGKYFSVGIHATQNHNSLVLPGIGATTADTGYNVGSLTAGDGNRLINYNNPFDSIYNILNPIDGAFGPVIGTIMRPGRTGGTVSEYVRAGHDASTGEVAEEALVTPPPGITSINIERKNNGQINSAQVEIVVPTLTQFEALADIFFVPGVTMILEWGSLSSTTIRELTTATKAKNTNELKTLPWHDLNKIESLLMQNSGFGPATLEIFQDYSYPSNGKYCFIIGKLASFEAKMSQTGEFVLTIKLIGPGEQNFAYSIYETVSAVVPEDEASTVAAGGSVAEYFKPNSFYDILCNRPSLAGGDWANHVIRLPRQSSVGVTAPTESPLESAEAQQKLKEEQDNSPTFLSQLEENSDPVFISWKFFINVVLNDSNVGIKKLFKEAGISIGKELDQIRLVHPLSLDANDPDEPFVGCHTYMRSTDPSVCIIYNAAAEAAIRNGNSPWRAALGDQYLSRTADNNPAMFAKFGSIAENSTHDRGLLSRGLWLNAAAVRQSMLSGNTIHDGIANLLNRINNCVNNYWELTLDFEKEEYKYGTTQPIDNYIIIDRKYRGVIDNLRNNAIYKFNKFYNPQTQVGSELIDFTVGLNTPPLLMTQLAFSRPSVNGSRGVVAGGYDSSTQTLFQPTNDGNLSLIDIDIVRKNIQAQSQPRNVGGAVGAAAGQPGATSTTAGRVIEGQATQVTQVSTNPVQARAETRSRTQNEAEITYKKNQITQLEAQKSGSSNPAEIDKQINALSADVAILSNVVSPGAKAQIAANRFPHLRPIFTLIEFAPQLMTRLMLAEPLDPGYTVNNNLKYSLNPLEANLVMPGIAGIRIGELVRLGRLPRRLFENRGAWQIMGITDKLSPGEGWVTSLRCRFMPLPTKIVSQLRDI
jgi:hypothetical protein